jgi:hypothetical protein
MRHLAPELSIEQLMPLSLLAIVGADLSRSYAPAHIARAR